MRFLNSRLRPKVRPDIGIIAVTNENGKFVIITWKEEDFGSTLRDLVIGSIEEFMSESNYPGLEVSLDRMTPKICIMERQWVPSEV